MTDEKKVLSRADFLAASQNLKRELVDVPELGGAVYLRELDARQVLEYNAQCRKIDQSKESSSVDLMALLISMSARDESGDLLFTENDVEALAGLKLDTLTRLSNQAMRLMSTDEKEIQEVAANPKNAPTSSLSTD